MKGHLVVRNAFPGCWRSVGPPRTSLTPSPIVYLDPVEEYLFLCPVVLCIPYNRRAGLKRIRDKIPSATRTVQVPIYMYPIHLLMPAGSGDWVQQDVNSTSIQWPDRQEMLSTCHLKSDRWGRDLGEKTSTVFSHLDDRDYLSASRRVVIALQTRQIDRQPVRILPVVRTSKHIALAFMRPDFKVEDYRS
jgi:hypothetical protein